VGSPNTYICCVWQIHYTFIYVLNTSEWQTLNSASTQCLCMANTSPTTRCASATKESQSNKMRINNSYSPIFTGKPGGSFIRTNSLSLLKCLKGAITSSTFSNISTDSGKSGLWKYTTYTFVSVCLHDKDGLQNFIHM